MVHGKEGVCWLRRPLTAREKFPHFPAKSNCALRLERAEA